MTQQAELISDCFFLRQVEMNANELVYIFGCNMILAVLSLKFFEQTVAFEIDIIPHQTN